MAFYRYERLFRSYEVMFTDTHFYDEAAYFPLEDVRATQRKDTCLILGLQQVGKLLSHTIDLGPLRRAHGKGLRDDHPRPER